MIVTCGENVIDMIMREDGAYRPIAGGSALNIAIGLGSMGSTAGYAMPISSDALGSILLAELEKRGVAYLPPVRPDRPTGLAVVSLLPDGQPEYGFYRSGAADTEISADEMPEMDPAVVEHVHVGGSPSLGHDVCGEVVLEWIEGLPRSISVSLDPNVRPALIDDRDRFLARIERIIARSTICRLSNEDAEYILGITDADGIADMLLEKGAPLVAVTKGADGALLANANSRATAHCPLPGPMSDAVAGGDTYMAALLTMLRRRSALHRGEVSDLGEAELHEFCRFACAAAAINCTRAGCQPPRFGEVNALLEHQQKLG